MGQEKEMILLGAGASQEAGVPTATLMTKRMCQIFEQGPQLKKHSEILNFVVGALIFNKSCDGKSPYGELNIEDVFNAVDLLANRDTLQADAFVSAWHPVIRKFEYRKPSPVALPQIIVREDCTNKEIMRYVTSLYHAIRAIDQKEDRYDKTIFNQLQENMILKLVDMTFIENEEKVRYLEPLIRHIAKQKGHPFIVTLNYDNTIELAASILGLTCGIGIDSWNRERVTIEAGNIILFKLHGSVNWKIAKDISTTDAPLPHDIIEEVDTSHLKENGLSYKPAVIFGGQNKLTSKGPYLDIFKNFQDYLSCSNLLTVIGYSFQDMHVNDVITDWLNRNPHTKIRIINGKSYTGKKGFGATLKRSIPDRVTIIQKDAGDGIKELYMDESP